MNKRKKSLWLFAAAVVLAVLSALPLQSYAAGVAANQHPARVVDNAGLLSETEIARLTSQFDNISESTGCDVAVVTVASTGGKLISVYADDYYDENGYGLGDAKSGVLLLVSMQERDWYISTAGTAVHTFTYDILGTIGDEVASYLSDEKYYDAFSKFGSLAEKYIKNASVESRINNGGSGSSGVPSGGGNSNITRETVMTYMQPVLVAFLIAAAISLAIVFAMKSQLKSVRHKLTARDYVRRDSMRITNSAEFFLFRTVSRVARPQNPPPGSGSRGGGTSFGGMHTSSSGASHGGRGGKF